MKSVLKLENVTKKYKKRYVVYSVSFSVFEGEILGFVGPNGAGKSTTLKMITGLTDITSGDITICGHDVRKNFIKAIENVGAMIENPVMYGNFSGYKNLKLYADLINVDAKKRIDNVVKLVGMEDSIFEKYSTYSLGMKQRMGIALSLLSNPKLLVLDEPTNGLDPNGIRDLRELLLKLAKKANIAIIVSSHNLAELEQMCDKVAIIDKGRLIEYKSMIDLKNIYSETQNVVFSVNYPNFAAKVLYEKFDLDVKVAGNNIIVPIKERHIAVIVSVLTMNKITIYGIDKQLKSLEDVYFKILKKQRMGGGDIGGGLDE